MPQVADILHNFVKSPLLKLAISDEFTKLLMTILPDSSVLFFPALSV